MSQQAKADDSRVAQTLDMLKTGKFSDFRITCRGEVFSVHENILYANSSSKYFQANVDGAFKEYKTAELELIDVNPVCNG
jgi:hypothetical protein